MTEKPYITALARHIRRWNGSTLEWDSTPYRTLVEAIRREEATLTSLSNSAIAERAAAFRNAIPAGTTLPISGHGHAPCHDRTGSKVPHGYHNRLKRPGSHDIRW